MKKTNEKECDCGNGRHRVWCCKRSHFPAFAVFLFIVSLVWLLNDLGILSINLPWIPLALLIISVAWLSNHYAKSEE
ncbi:Uncharacterised protein [uncultured archaeon]|nr:Uncharacterised protein [uncultured archaeon]